MTFNTLNCLKILISLIIHEVCSESVQKSSLVFVIDITSSMSKDINAVKAGANAIFDTVVNSDESPIENFILVTFGDPHVSDVVTTTSRSVFKKALTSIRLEIGGDCPEYSMSGIKKAIESSLPGSYVYVFTDASAKDFVMYEEVKHIAQEKDCQVVFILTGKCKISKKNKEVGSLMYEVYLKLASVTSGQVFHLRKRDMAEILEYVKDSIKSRRIIIFTRGYESGVHTMDIELDNRTDEVMVALSGSHPEVTIKGPGGEPLDEDVLVDLNDILIIKVSGTGPGVHNLTLKSRTPSHVVVSARSDIRFYHGFSAAIPLFWNNTAFEPVPDIKNYLSIKLIGERVNLTSAKFVDPNYHKLLPEIPLKLLDEEQKIYITDPFYLPKHQCRIAVKGIDMDNNATIIRFGNMLLGSDDVKTEKNINKKPTVNIKGVKIITVEYNGPLHLECTVNAHPEPRITWKVNGTALPITASIRDSPYDFTNILDLENVNKNGTYECIAENTLEIGEDIVYIKVKPEPVFNVLEKPKSMEVDYDADAVLKCKVDAFPPAKITWYSFPRSRNLLRRGKIIISPDGSTLTIKHMRPSASGKFACKAENAHRLIVTYANITTSAKTPKINKTCSEIHIKEGETTHFNCSLLEGKPKPEIRWYYKRGLTSLLEFTEIEEATNQTIISLRNVNRYDTGVYKCTAKNVMGEDKHIIHFFAECSPTIKDDVNYIVAKEGQEIFMTCMVDCVTDPEKVVWLKDGVPIDSGIHVFKDHSFKLKADLHDSGIYTCTARSNQGSAQKTVEVVVCTFKIKPPDEDIILARRNKKVTLNCIAEGEPEPTLKWIYYSFDTTVPPKTLSATGSKFIIKKYKRNQQGYYTCEASNICDFKKITYEVADASRFKPTIQPDLKSIYKAVEGDQLLKIHCRATGVPTPVITWNKNGVPLAPSDRYIMKADWLIIKDVQISDAADTYNCEAKNKHGIDNGLFEVVVLKAAKINVDVKSKPTFVTDETRSMELELGQFGFLSCKASGLPTPTVTWWHNRTYMAFSEMVYNFEMNMKNVGEYYCRVTNDFGSISRTFDLTLKGCFLKSDLNPKYQPLMITTSGTWPAFKVIDGYTVIPKNQHIVFSCPKHFTKFYRPDVAAQCVNGSNLNIDGILVDYTDLKCNEELKPRIIPKREMCYGVTSKVYKIVFDLSHKTIEAFEVCVDGHGNTIYAKHNMRSPAGYTPEDTSMWDGSNLGSFYNCRNQQFILSRTLKTIFRFKSNCCYAMRYLINPKDVFPGSLQRATFNHLNVVPHWSSCHSENWNEVEDRVRKLVKSINNDLIVYTGTAQYLTLPNRYGRPIPVFLNELTYQPIPLYLWKVIQYPAQGSSLAIIQVNIEEVPPAKMDEYVLCRDICQDLPWMKSSNWHNIEQGYTYCCDLTDFERVLSYGGVFVPKLDKVLNETITL